MRVQSGTHVLEIVRDKGRKEEGISYTEFFGFRNCPWGVTKVLTVNNIRISTRNWERRLLGTMSNPSHPWRLRKNRHMEVRLGSSDCGKFHVKSIWRILPKCFCFSPHPLSSPSLDFWHASSPADPDLGEQCTILRVLVAHKSRTWFPTINCTNQESFRSHFPRVGKLMLSGFS